MTLFSRTRFALAIGLSLVVLPALGGYARAQDKDGDKPDKKAVSFRSVDGVELKGTFWSTTKARKNACVLLLHNFSRKSGGNRNDDGWNDLAEDLAKDGYNVLSFDFRGHGESTSIGKEFWNKQFQHNLLLLKGTVKPENLPTKIDYKDFTQNANYYPHLVDDIAAAKEYLNSAAGKTAGNLVVIGAGEGATLGALWINAELRRYREKTENGMGPPQLQNFETEPEGRDIACAIWLSLSPTVDGKQVSYDTWLEEVGASKKNNKVPMLFLYGKDDATNGTALRTARTALQRVSPGWKMLGSDKGEGKDPAIKFTRDYAVDTKLEGSQMLQSSLNTGAVIKGWVNKVIEDRGDKAARRHDCEKFRYVWVSPLNIRMPRVAKQAGEEFMLPIPVIDPGIR